MEARWSMWLAVSAIVLGGACGDDGGGGAADAMTPGSDAAGCPAGMQDDNGDGSCNPECSASTCEHGTCAVSGTTGLAECTCEPGYAGDSCAELDVPTSSEIAFWLDAADSASVVLHDGATAVETWTDVSAGALQGTTASAAAAPIVVEDALGGKPVIRFDGIDDAMTFTGWSGIAGKSYTIFLVMRAAAADTGTLVHAAGPGDELELLVHGLDGIQAVHQPDGQDQSNVFNNASMYGDAGWTSGDYHLVTIVKGSAHMAAWIDGNHAFAIPNPNTVALTETLTVVLGQKNGGAAPMAGDIAELIVVADDLIYEDRARYEAYLGAKWFGAAFAPTPSAFGLTTIWLDASQTDTITTVTGDAVTGWRNLGYDGGSFANGSFADARPVLVTGALGGHPVVRFDGGDTLVQNAIATQGGAEEGDYTIIVVLVPPTTGTSQIVVQATDGSPGDPGLRLSVAPTVPGVEWLHRWPTGTDGGETFLPAADFSSPQLIKIERSAGAAYQVVIDDSPASFSGSVANNVPQNEELNWSLGGDAIAAPGASALTGDIAEVIVIDESLGNSEETALLALLRAKWGI